MGKSYYLNFIDGIKGMAIVMVIMVHVYGLAHGGSYIFQTSADLFTLGARGVQLLFMISAFTLMNSNSAKSKHTDKQKKSFSIQFYKRRLTRIYPLWVITVLAGTLLHANYNLYSIITSLTFLFGFIRYLPNTEIITGGWAVFAELIFYLFFPLIFKYAKDIKSSLKFLTITILITLIWRFAVSTLGVPYTNSYSFLFPLNHAYSFGLGVFFYQIWRRFELDQIGTSWLNIWTFLSILLLLTKQYDLSTLGIFIIFICSASAKSIIGIISRMKLFKFIGMISYPIFLIHFFIIELFEKRILIRGYLTLTEMPNEFRIIIWGTIITGSCVAIGYILHSVKY